MSIVLLILKIIGILLLVILGLLVLAVLSLLVVPVRYRIRGDALEWMDVHVRVSWLLHILTFCADYDEKEFRKKILLLGFPLKKKSGRKEGRAKKTKKKKSVKSNLEVINQKRVEETDEKKDTVAELQADDKKTATELMPDERKEASGDRFARIHSFFHQIKKLPGMIKSKWETLKEKVKSLKKAFLDILKEVNNESNWEAMRFLWAELKLILGRIAPKKIRVNGSFSLGDPSNTGQALGLISVFPFIYRYQIQLYPDFEAEQSYFKGSFDIRGSVYGIHVLILFVHLLKDKNIRGLIDRYHNS